MKWLSAIELTTFEADEGYWIPRGWAREGPVKTQTAERAPVAPDGATGRHTIEVVVEG